MNNITRAELNSINRMKKTIISAAEKVYRKVWDLVETPISVESDEGEKLVVFDNECGEWYPTVFYRSGNNVFLNGFGTSFDDITDFEFGLLGIEDMIECLDYIARNGKPYPEYSVSIV